MIHVFKGETANDVWKEAFFNFQDDDFTLIHQGRGGGTKEILHAAFCIEKPLQRWVLAREPAINPAFALAEVLWILNGQNNSAFLNSWNTQLPRFAGSGQTYHGAYGFRLRNHFQVDQLNRAYQALKNNPESRQVVLLIWDPVVDLPNTKGKPANRDIPCNLMSMLKIRNNKLEWTQIMRSNDLFKGTPYNFIQFTYLHEVIAGWLDIEVGSYNHFSDSLHYYLQDEESGFNISDIDIVPNPDTLFLPKNKSESVFKTLYNNVQLLVTQELDTDQFLKKADANYLPLAYKNMFLVMLAEAARRKKFFELAQDIIAECSNPVLVQAWQRWFLRFHE